MNICASPCYADPFYVTVQITADLAYPGYVFSRLAACWHAGFVRTFLITERVTICVAICVCTVLILRDWSHDHLLIHFARANRSRKFSDMFGETRLIHRSQYYVCKLRRALYGLKQAPREWNQLLTTWLVSYGFSQNLADPGCYTITVDGHLYVLCCYVDDCCLVGVAGPFIAKFKADFGKRFKIEDLGPVSWLLGCEITRDRKNKTISIGQRQFCIDLLDQFGMSDCGTVGTPLSARTSDVPVNSLPLNTKQFDYPALVGKLLYLSNCTRPDIFSKFRCRYHQSSSFIWSNDSNQLGRNRSLQRTLNPKRSLKAIQKKLRRRKGNQRRRKKPRRYPLPQKYLLRITTSYGSKQFTGNSFRQALQLQLVQQK